MPNFPEATLESVCQQGSIRALDVITLEQDGTQLEVPAEITHMFLFNSLTGSVLTDTLGQVQQSVERFPRALKLIRIQPITDLDPLPAVPRLRLECESLTGYWMHVPSRVYVHAHSTSEAASC